MNNESTGEAIMTSTATSRHIGGTDREYDSGRGNGLVIFA